MILAVIGTVTVLTAITILWFWSMKSEPLQISQHAFHIGEEKNSIGKITTNKEDQA